MCFSSAEPKRAPRSSRNASEKLNLSASTSTASGSSSPHIRQRTRRAPSHPDDLPSGRVAADPPARHASRKTSRREDGSSKSYRTASVTSSNATTRPRHSKRGSVPKSPMETIYGSPTKESPRIPTARVPRASTTRRQADSPRLSDRAKSRDTSVSDASRRSREASKEKERRDKRSRGTLESSRERLKPPKRSSGGSRSSRAESDDGSSRSGSEYEDRKRDNRRRHREPSVPVAPAGLGIMGITTDDTLPEGGEPGKGVPVGTTEIGKLARNPPEKIDPPDKPAKDEAPVLSAPAATFPPKVATTVRRPTGPTPVINVQAPITYATARVTEPVKEVLGTFKPAEKPYVRPIPFPTQPSPPPTLPREGSALVRVKDSSESEAVPSRRTSLSSISSDLTTSSASVSSDDSGSELELETEAETESEKEKEQEKEKGESERQAVPELSPRLPNSYAHVRPTKKKRPPRRLTAPEPEPEIDLTPTPAKALIKSPRIPDAPRRRKKRRQRRPLEDPEPPPALSVPFPVPPPPEYQPPRRRRRSSVSKSKEPPPPPLTRHTFTATEHAPKTPANKRTNSAPVANYDDGDTVDYAAFVAQSQKKKRQTSAKVEYVAAIPDPANKKHISDTVDYAVFVTETAKKIRPSTRTTTADANPAPLYEYMAPPTRRSTSYGDKPPPPAFNLPHHDPPPETPRNHRATLSTEPSSALFRPPSPTSSLAPTAPAIRRRRADSFPSAPSSDVTFDLNPSSEAPIPPPRAPSPPPPESSYEDHTAHFPPPGAAQAWFDQVQPGQGPIEVEQDWGTAGTWEEKGVDSRLPPDGKMPEAPSPPGSERGFTPASEKYYRMYQRAV